MLGWVLVLLKGGRKCQNKGTIVFSLYFKLVKKIMNPNILLKTLFPWFNKSFVRVNITNIAILMFLVIFTLIHYFKPALLYTKDGAFRQFGVGYKQKTVVPIWLVAIFLAILCYLVVLSYLVFF